MDVLGSQIKISEEDNKQTDNNCNIQGYFEKESRDSQYLSDYTSTEDDSDQSSINIGYCYRAVWGCTPNIKKQ